MRRAEVLLATEDLDAAQDDRPNSEDRFEAAERKALLLQLLATLEPSRRAVVIAYELEGMEMVDIAAATNISVNTCWTRLRLARADLRAAWTRLAATWRRKKK
jgi:RNA polymerase sigma-70 factor (ECF subfamily)